MKPLQTQLPVISFALTILLLISSPVLKGQFINDNFETTDSFFEWTEMPVFASALSTANPYPGGDWIVGGQLHDPLTFFSPPVVIKISATGTKLWEIIPMNYAWEVGHTEAITICSDGNILAAGSGWEICDVGLGGFFIEKYTSEGETIWGKRFYEESIGSKVVRVFELDSNEIGVLTQKLYYKLSADGDSLLMANFDLSSSDRFSSGLADGNRLLMAYRNRVLVTDPDGNLLSEHTFSSSIQNMHANGEFYFLLTENSLLKTNKSLVVTDSLDLSGFNSPERLNTFQDSLCILANGDQIATIDLSTLQLVQSPYQKPAGMETRALAVTDTLVLMAGISENNWNSALAIKTWSLNGKTQDYEMDAGIRTIEVTKVVYDEGKISWETRVTLHNYGNEILQSCYIGARLQGMRICGYSLYLQLFDALNLAPGDSTVLFLGEMTDGGFYVPDTGSFTYPLRLHTLIPNFKIDRNGDNDESEVSFEIRVGVDENLFRQLNIYPNPAKEYFTVEHSPQEAGWRLFTPSGKNIFSGESRAGRFSVDVSRLPRGLYLLQLSSRDGRRTIRKIVVD